MELVVAGEGGRAAELMRRHLERSLPSLVLNVLEGTEDIDEITGAASLPGEVPASSRGRRYDRGIRPTT
jgi:hypothetical protein